MPTPWPDDLNREWGTVLHRLLQLAAGEDTPNLLDTAALLLAEYGMDSSLADRAVSTIQAVKDSPLWKRVRESKRVFVEIPFYLYLEQSAQTKPALTRGVIDLVFEEESGWVVVDYKTDAVKKGEIKAAVNLHAPQVAFYVDAWQRLTGEKVKEAGLFFTRPSIFVPIELQPVK